MKEQDKQAKEKALAPLYVDLDELQTALKQSEATLQAARQARSDVQAKLRCKRAEITLVRWGEALCAQRKALLAVARAKRGHKSAAGLETGGTPSRAIRPRVAAQAPMGQ